MSPTNRVGSLVIADPYEILRSFGPRDADSLASLERILTRAMPSQRAADTSAASNGALWSESLLKLEQSSLFRNLPESSQAEIRRDCHVGLLKEAQMIELAGMVFTAKMSLLARTLEERELYSFFASDEAKHFRLVSRWAGSAIESDMADNPFLRFLADLIQLEEREVLVFLIQVVLEGWGIQHYSRLARSAMDPALGDVLHEILRDEARHHGCGLVLFSEDALSPQAFERLRSHMSTFLGIVRMGPGSVLGQIRKHHGAFSPEDVRGFIEDTAALKKIQSDLSEIEALVAKVNAHKLLRILRDEGLFAAPSLEECVRVLA